MPHFEDTSYRPPFWLRNGHLNTFYTYLFRNPASIRYERIRYETPDNDFFDTDWLKAGASDSLCILLHGLEGSSSSQYMLGTSGMLAENGFHVATLNFRSCSGVMNRTPLMYHSGFTADLHQVVGNAEKYYKNIYICGFSLGANVTFKYAGDGFYPLSPAIKGIAGVSVPCDLKAGSFQLQKRENKVYESRFLKTLAQKINEKIKQFPHLTIPKDPSKIKTIREFDDKYTAPIHGFAGCDDYYDRCGCKQYLHRISMPAIMINAWDDSFLPIESYPINEAANNKNLHLVTTKYGGHVGFTTFGSDYNWYESAILRFFKSGEVL